ncbi:MAG: PTS sugar transporter subunit IIA [Parasphingopyxis sp.]|nr:PTS sugar transporter subunit IIA [Sphingomonadales bacterium]
MREFGDLLGPGSVHFGIRVDGKKGLFKELSVLASPCVGAEPRDILAQLARREQLGSTGFGDGVGLPHAQFDSLDRPTGVFLRLARPVDYDSADDIPVDCVFALFSPREDGAAHLRALAQVSRRFRDEDFVAKLRGARSEDALYALLTDYAAADAA